MGPLEKAFALIEAQKKCTAIACKVLNDKTARAYCEPREAPFEHVHVTLNEENVTCYDNDPLAYWDSDDGGDEIPGTEALKKELQRLFPGVSLSVVIMC